MILLTYVLYKYEKVILGYASDTCQKKKTKILYLATEKNNHQKESSMIGNMPNEFAKLNPALRKSKT